MLMCLTTFYELPKTDIRSFQPMTVLQKLHCIILHWSKCKLIRFCGVPKDLEQQHLLSVLNHTLFFQPLLIGQGYSVLIISPIVFWTIWQGNFDSFSCIKCMAQNWTQCWLHFYSKLSRGSYTVFLTALPFISPGMMSNFQNYFFVLLFFWYCWLKVSS